MEVEQPELRTPAATSPTKSPNNKTPATVIKNNIDTTIDLTNQKIDE